MLDLKRVGERIHQCRISAGLSQEDIAETLHLSRQAISLWETGVSAPSIDNVISLTRIFNVSFERLLCIDESMPIDPEDIFRGSSREFVIHELMEGKLNVKLSDVFYQLSPKERTRILQHKMNTNQPVPHDLRVKLTLAELQMINKEDRDEKSEHQ